MRRVIFILLLWMVNQQAGAASLLPRIQTVFVILLENGSWANIQGNTNAPYLNNTILPLASHCRQYYTPAGIHPSEPNYLWLEAGTNFGILDDNPPAINSQNTTNHLTTLLNNAGISWKTYQESIPGDVLPLSIIGALYDPKHNPFVFFDDVTGTNDSTNAYGLAHVRPFSEFAGDLGSNTVARYNFITPNLCDDGHDCPITTMDDWLAEQIPLILNSPAYTNNGAIFIAWDEGTAQSDGPIGLIVLSPLARGGGYYNNVYYDHSSMLRTLQEIFNVGPFLNAAANATDLSDLFGMTQAISPIGFSSAGFQMTCSGLVPGMRQVVQCSTDLLNWSPISTNFPLTDFFIFSDTTASNSGRRFYRLEQSPGP